VSDETTVITELCPVIKLEWDRGHESIEAIVRARTESGIVVTTLNDYVALPGLTWIRADEVLYFDNLEELDDDHPAVRLANLRGSRIGSLDPALTDLNALLGHLAVAAALVFIYLRHTGSGEGLVGRITRRAKRRVQLDEVDTDARATGDVLDFALADIIAVEWGQRIPDRAH
jgi:hypothetical protein